MKDDPAANYPGNRWEGIATGAGRFTVLGRDEIEALHAATLDLLPTVGTLVHEPGLWAPGGRGRDPR